MTLPNLILTLACNYDLRQIEPFIASFVRQVPGTRLCLFATTMDLPFYHAAEGYDFEVRNARPYLALGLHAMLARFLMYDDYLASVRHAYRNVLITDVRDVVFQADPFAQPLDGIVFAAEDKAIIECPFNQSWIREVYGEEELAEIANRQISCAGTTIGTSGAVAHYTGLMRSAIEIGEFKKTKSLDQGIHNGIVWAVRPPGARFDRDGLLMRTLGHTAPERISVGDGLIGVDGHAAPIIHQFDRHPALAAFVAQDARFRLEELN